MRARLITGLVTVVSLGMAAAVSAKDPVQGVLPGTLVTLATPHSVGVPGPSFGTDSTTRLTLGPCDAAFRSNTGVVPWESPNCVSVFPSVPGNSPVAFPVHLPTGALITSITLNYYDSDPADPFASLYRTTPAGGFELVVDMAVPVFDLGTNAVTYAVVPPHQFDNDYAYQFIVGLHRTDEASYQAITRFAVDYQLQVSPAPGTATFGDVPTNHPFFQFIEALAASGITVGCGGGDFCPNSPLTRGQMAVFLAKALGLHFPG